MLKISLRLILYVKAHEQRSVSLHACFIAIPIYRNIAMPCYTSHQTISKSSGKDVKSGTKQIFLAGNMNIIWLENITWNLQIIEGILDDRGSHGLVDKGVGLVMKFRVQIPKKLVVVLGRASNLKLLLCYIRKFCSVACIIEYPSDTPNEKKLYRFLSSAGKNGEVKIIGRFFMLDDRAVRKISTVSSKSV